MWHWLCIRIYSVGVWNIEKLNNIVDNAKLEFTPLEFETDIYKIALSIDFLLEFTPLEFETRIKKDSKKEMQAY